MKKQVNGVVLGNLCFDDNRVSGAGSDEAKTVHSEFEMMLLVDLLSSPLSSRFSSLF